MLLRSLAWLGVWGFALGGIGSVQAQQVVPDSSLNTQVTRSGSLFTITGGSLSGNHLFHSFSEFSVPTGGEASFSHGLNVQNIFARVTGNSPSSLNGRLSAMGSANLFLLNPNGILFGPNSQLNLGGSFIATTAEAIKFADGTEFRATSPIALPLLTMSVPIGLQMGQNPGNISVQGTGHSGVVVPSSGSVSVAIPPYPNVTPQLRVQAGQTLSLIGGNITVDGGKLSAADGRIELGSLAGNQTVMLRPLAQGFSFDYTGVSSFQDIYFTKAAIDVSGSSGGGLQLQGRRITLTNGSELLAHSLGKNAIGQGIRLRATEALEVIGTQSAQAIPTIMASLYPNASGKGGDITIDTPNFKLADGAYVRAELYGRGQGGNIKINTTNFEMLGGDYSGQAGTVTVLSGGVMGSRAQGRGGTLTIQAEHMRLANGARLRSDLALRGIGQPGDIYVQTNDLEITGVVKDRSVLNSWISSTVDSNTIGQAGNITIDAQHIRLADSGTIRADVVGVGMGGTITLRAPDIEVTGFNDLVGRSSRITAQVSTDALASSQTKGGNILIEGQRLSLNQGGQIRTSTRSIGDAGNLSISTTESVVIQGAYYSIGKPLVSSSIQSVVDENAIGNAGNIFINTPQLRVLNGGEMTAAVFGNGNAGNINIQAGSVEVAGRTADGLQPSQITAATNPVLGRSTGAAGSIQMNANQLTVKDGAEISVSGQQLGEAGNLRINTGVLRLDNQASLRADVRSGSEGNITITANDLIMRRGSQITTNAGNNANGGNITINAAVIAGFENSDIVANAVRGSGGNIQITTQGIFGLKFRPQLTPENDITASSQFGVNGSVQVNNVGVDPNSGLSELPTELVDASQQVASQCAAKTGSRFVLTGRGGILQDPTQASQTYHPWQDLRHLPIASKPSAIGPLSKTDPAPPALLEATTWQQHPQTGQIELIAAQATQPTAIATCANSSANSGKAS
jgi:filamentous hemagglutinin family protein